MSEPPEAAPPEVPTVVADDEPLRRRIHPTFRKEDGSVSSQAFTDPELSVDRGRFREAEESLLNYEDCGLAEFVCAAARELEQEVRSDRQLLNDAHALVVGRKTKRIAKSLARACQWVVQIPA